MTGGAPTPSTLGDGGVLEAEATRARAVALRLLDESAAAAALDVWRREGQGESFARHLVRRGLLSEEGASRLREESLSPARIGPGLRVSGCVLERQLGQGGMGTVWLARRQETGEPVVVKFLSTWHAQDPAWRARFAREGLVTRQVEHPNLIRVHAVETAGACPHLVMELVEGEDLADRLAREGRIPPLEATRILRDVALGLAAAHARGIVHRDVKPGNVRVTPQGQVKLLDFGLARAVTLDDGVSTAGQILGTPHYMPPEQWGDHRVDARGDVYALGATLYHLVTGALPFPGQRPLDVCRRTLEGELVRPRELAPSVPEALELVILRMMSRDRRCRYRDAGAAALALQAVLDGAPVDVPALIELHGPEQAPGRVHPLLPGTRFVLGRDPACEVHLAHPSVAPRHAQVELGRAGYRLLDLGFGVQVSGVTVNQAMLKPGDVLRLGQVELLLHDAGVAGAPPGAAGAPGRLRVEAVGWPLFEALVETGDRRVVLALMERLPLDALLDDAREGGDLVREVLRDQELAARVERRMEEVLRARRVRTPEQLFRITHENLGHDEEAWLSWWEEAWTTFPPQVAPEERPPRWFVRVEGEGPPHEAALGQRLVCAVGRGAGSDLLLSGASVSRHHATLLRLDRRLVVRDEGSRFGTQLRGAPVRLAFLHHGAQVRLGATTLRVEADPDPAPPDARGLQGVDADLFDALAGLGHRSTACGLLRLASGASGAWARAEAVRLCPATERARALAAAATQVCAQRAALATQQLAALFPDGPGKEAGTAAWDAFLAPRWGSLGPQLLPLGWGDAIYSTTSASSASSSPASPPAAGA